MTFGKSLNTVMVKKKKKEKKKLRFLGSFVAEKNVFDYNEKGSYFQQIVRYGKHGHYHAHFDSETDKRTDKRCCQLHEDVVQAFNKDEGCRLCR